MTKGTLFIISAPSGTGKTSLVKGLLDTLNNIKVSISHTTRAIRPGEIDGVNYHFVSEATFNDMVAQDAFLESANVYDFQYGTSRAWVEAQLEQGIDVILEIEWQGGQQIIQRFSEVVSIFILPPTQDALKQRLMGRGQDELNIIERRLNEAKKEVEHCQHYDYIVLNDQFEKALSDLRSIIRAEHCLRKKRYSEFESLISTLMQ